MNTNEVREALGDIFDDVSLVWYDSTNAEDIISVHWNSEESRSGNFYADENSVAIWFCPVNAADKSEANELLCEQILPDCAEWIAAASAQDEAWQGLNHSLAWGMKDGKPIRKTHDQSPKRRR